MDWTRRTRAGALALVPFLIAGSTPALAQAMVQAIPAPGAPMGDADRLAAEVRTLAANPRDVGALVRAGTLSAKLGDSSAATAFFARAEAVEPNNPRLLAGRGSMAVRMGRPGEALRLFQEAERRGAPVPEFAADRGLAYALLGAPQLAQRDYRLALSRDENDETLLRLALSLGVTGQVDEATTLLDPLLRRQDRPAWRARAFILAMNGDAAGAEKIATSMMPGQLGQSLLPFFRRLPQLSPADRAFAVEFGELSPTPARIADARTAPPLPAFVPDRPVQVATAAPVRPVERGSRRDRAKPGRQPVPQTPAPVAPAVTSPPVVASVTPTPAPVVQPIRTPVVAPASAPIASAPLAGSATAAVTPAPSLVQPAVPAGAPSVSAPPASVAAARTPAVEVSRAPATPVPASAPVPAPPATPVVSAAAETPDVLRLGLQPAPAPVLPAPAPLPARVELASAPPAPAPGITAMPRPASAAPQPATPEPVDPEPSKPEPPRAEPVAPAPAPRVAARPARHESALASIVAGITIPAAELGVAAMPEAAAPPAKAAPRPAKADPKPNADEDAVKPAKAATKAGKSKPEADDEAAKPGKSTKTGKLAADKPDAKKKGKDDPSKAEPARVWVQVAGGANPGDLPKAWKQVTGKAPAAFKGKSGWSTPLKATNRVLAGPFKSADEAQDFVNGLRKQGVSAFVFTSEAGQKVTRLDGK